MANDGKTVPVVWTDNEEAPILFANTFISQFTEAGEFIISAGQLSPPVLLGTDADRKEQIERIDWVPVKTVARFSLNEERVQELIRILQENLKGFRASKGGSKTRGR